KRAAAEGNVTVANKHVTQTADPNVRHAETKLMRSLGTNVKIRPSGKGNSGKIEIEYYSAEDLDRLYSLLMGERDKRAGAV
ncbi:MAG TPA: chromosome partitioning protein ParB, partial [Blastocatellia bacterium]|nr:chromosome partitioning protein ParB [Blastocatellia bacterium]